MTRTSASAGTIVGGAIGAEPAIVSLTEGEAGQAGTQPQPIGETSSTELVSVVG